jgi:hypothetical protein
MPHAKAASPVFAVERLNWRATSCANKGFKALWVGYVLLPGSRRLRSFADEAEAAAFCAEQERAVRARANPFACGGPTLHYLTNLDADRLHDWLVDAGVDDAPRTSETAHWLRWWDSAAQALTAGQKDRLWEGLDKVRFHRVVERPARRTVYVVTRRQWDYNDEWYFPVSASGEPVEAYSSREKAEAVRARKEREERRNWNYIEGMEVTSLRWASAEPPAPLPDPHEDIFADPNDRLFFEVVELELGE